MVMGSPGHLLNTGSSQGKCSVQSFEMMSVYRIKGDKHGNSGGSTGSREAFSFGKAALLRQHAAASHMQQQGGATPDLFQKRPPGLLPHPESGISTAEKGNEDTDDLTTLDFSKACSPSEIQTTILGLSGELAWVVVFYDLTWCVRSQEGSLNMDQNRFSRYQLVRWSRRKMSILL